MDNYLGMEAKEYKNYEFEKIKLQTEHQGNFQ